MLPAVTLATFSTPLLLRIVRSSMLEVINLDYVRTARAKGVSEWFVICRHALINAALPLVTVAGLQFGLLLGGAVITETVFAVPGLGRLIVGAIRQLDFPIVQAGVFLHRPDGGARELRGGPAVRLPESADPGALSAMAIGTLAPPMNAAAGLGHTAERSRVWRKFVRNPAAIAGALILLGRHRRRHLRALRGAARAHAPEPDPPLHPAGLGRGGQGDLPARHRPGGP